MTFGLSVSADAVRFSALFPGRPIHTELCMNTFTYLGQWKQVPTSLKNTQGNLDRPPSPRTLLTWRAFIISKISMQKSRLGIRCRGQDREAGASVDLECGHHDRDEGE